MTHNPTPEQVKVLTAIADGTEVAKADPNLAELRSAGLVTKRGLKLTATGTEALTLARVQRRSQFKPEVLADIVARIKVMRAERKGWATIAKAFNDEGVKAAKGGTWPPSQVRAVGMRADIPTRLD